jgi:dedicator of cytokinesis protein 3
MDEEGTTLKDGPHELFIYKCEDRSKLRDARSYLGLPFNPGSTSAGAVIGNQAFQRSLKESLSISTLLVSTKLTQNSKRSKIGIIKSANLKYNFYMHSSTMHLHLFMK